MTKVLVRADERPMATRAEAMSGKTQREDFWGMESIKIGHIDGGQMTRMLVFMVATKIFLMTPSMVIARTGTSAWISLLIASALGFLGLAGWLIWTRQTGSLGIVPSLRLTLGRVPGDAVALFILVFVFLGISLNIRIFAGGTVVGLLPEMPIEPLIMVMAGSGMYAAWLGLESVARTAVFFFPLIVSALILVVAAAYRLADLRRLLPIWGLGIDRTLLTGLENAGGFGAMVALPVLKSYLRKPEDVRASGLKGVGWSSFFLVTGVATVLAVFPYPASARQVVPLGIMARSIYLGRFVQRVEAVFAFVWFFAAAVQASISYLLILVMLSQLTGTRTYRPFVPAVVLLSFGIAAIPASIHRAGELIRLVLLTAGNAVTGLGWVLAAVGAATRVQDKARALGQDDEAEASDEGGQSR